MTDKQSTLPRTPDEVDQQFFETLREAAFIFEKEVHGRFTGSPMIVESCPNSGPSVSCFEVLTLR